MMSNISHMLIENPIYSRKYHLAQHKPPPFDRNSLPAPLRKLLDRRLVNEAWVKGLGKGFLDCFRSEDMCALIADGFLKPADLPLAVPIRAVLALSGHALLRSLLRDGAVRAKDLAILSNVDLHRLCDDHLHARLSDPTVRQKLRRGEQTIYQILDNEPADLRSVVLGNIKRIKTMPKAPRFDILPSGKVSTPRHPTTVNMIKRCQPLWELVQSGKVTLQEATSLDYSHVTTIDGAPSICVLLDHHVISPAELVSLRFDHFALLTSPEVRRAVLNGTRIISNGMLVRNTTAVSGVWLAARGALNLASTGHAQPGAVEFDDRYCINPSVLRAIGTVLRSAEQDGQINRDHPWYLLRNTLAIVFKNAFDYGYLENLLPWIAEQCPALHAAMDTVFDTLRLADKLKDMGVRFTCTKGQVVMADIMPAVDQIIAEQVINVLATGLIARQIGLGVVKGYLDPPPTSH